MLLFLLTLAVAAAGVGAYGYYNPGTLDVTLRTYHFTGVPKWEVAAVAAGVPLVPYLLYAVYVSVRIRVIRRSRRSFTTGRTFDDLPGGSAAQPAPKRSWTTSGD